MKTTALLLATLATTSADEYFTGDGTAYTLGQTSAGNCNMMQALDFATTYYAALNDKQWDGLQNCGRCAEVSCDDDRCSDKSTSIVVQILDRCPECAYGDLDLSPTVFTALTGSTPSRYTIKWKFVDCPVSGNVNYCLKGGSNNYWTAIQPTNVATGVKSLQINGQDTTMLGSAYYYLLDGASQTQTDLTSVKISLTDVNGNSIEDTVSLTDSSCTEGASQFPNSGGSAPSTQTQTTTTPTPTTAAPTTATPTNTPAPTTAKPTTSPPVPSTATPTQTPSSTTVRPTSPATTAPTAQQQSSPTPVPVSTTAAPTAAPVTDAPTTTIPATSSPSTTAPATFAPATIIPVDITQESQSVEASTTGSDASQTAEQGSASTVNATSTAAPKSTTSTKTTKTGVTTSAPSTEQEQQASVPTSATAAPSSNTDQTSDNQTGGDDTQSANTKSNEQSSGTDWTIVGLSSAAGVGVVALIVVVVMVKRKQIRDEKARDFEAPSMMQSFDIQNTPADRARNFGVL